MTSIKLMTFLGYYDVKVLFLETTIKILTLLGYYDVEVVFLRLIKLLLLCFNVGLSRILVKLFLSNSFGAETPVSVQSLPYNCESDLICEIL